jgi:hypothetical protein
MLKNKKCDKRKGFLFSGLMLIILTVVIVSGNYIFLSSRAYESGVGRVMLIDAVMNAHDDMKNIVVLGDDSILLDTVQEAVSGGCSMSGTTLKDTIETRVDTAFQDFNTLLSMHGITLTKDDLKVTGSVGSAKKCKASATVKLDFTVETTDNSIKKTGYLEGSASAP